MPARSVLILGGTGFIGWHAAHEFLRRGWRVTAVALPPLPAPDLFPPQVRMKLADFGTMSDDAFSGLLQGHETAVFAIGADDRTTTKAPAYPFFKQTNVDTTARFVRLCCRAGVRNVGLLGSYFCHFARVRPELELARHHPYIRSRVKQEDAAVTEAGTGIKLAILELPYVFGAMPGRIPLWKPLVDYVRSAPLLLYPRGGTNCISVQHVAEAVVGAVGRNGLFLVGDENLSWRNLLGRISELTGCKKPVVTLPDWSVHLGAVLLRTMHTLQGLESGLEPVEFVKVQTAETYFNPSPARNALGFGSGDLDNALAATVSACTAKRQPTRS
jgi:nucleoside-diphosphate-sugar epimerase